MKNLLNNETCVARQKPLKDYTRARHVKEALALQPSDWALRPSKSEGCPEVPHPSFVRNNNKHCLSTKLGAIFKEAWLPDTCTNSAQSLAKSCSWRCSLFGASGLSHRWAKQASPPWRSFHKERRVPLACGCRASEGCGGQGRAGGEAWAAGPGDSHSPDIRPSDQRGLSPFL